MNDQNKKEYPHLIVGAFIFNDKQELFMVKAPKWKNKYVVPGGHIEMGETALEALHREIKEETDMEIADVEFMSVSEAPDLSEYKNHPHMVFLNYRVRFQGDDQAVKLNHEAVKYKWQTVDKWLSDPAKIGMATLEVLNDKHWERIGLEAKYRRALADYQNLLKRTAAEREEFIKYAQENFILAILPALDNLKASLQHIDETAVQNGWAEGIKYVVKQFTDTLAEMGVEEIEAAGKNFDPASMEAVEGKGEKVRSVARPGYRLKGKVIVPARVVVE